MVTSINIRTRFGECTRFQVKSWIPRLNATYMGKPSIIFGNGSCRFVLRILVGTIKHSKTILKYYVEIDHSRFHSHPLQFVVILKSSYYLTLSTYKIETLLPVGKQSRNWMWIPVYQCHVKSNEIGSWSNRYLELEKYQTLFCTSTLA
jgi:hypothetical protein